MEGAPVPDLRFASSGMTRWAAFDHRSAPAGPADHLVIPETPKALSGTGVPLPRVGGKRRRRPARPWGSGGGCGRRGRGGWSPRDLGLIAPKSFPRFASGLTRGARRKCSSGRGRW